MPSGKPSGHTSPETGTAEGILNKNPSYKDSNTAAVLQHPCLDGNPHSASVILSAGRGLRNRCCFEKMLLLADSLQAQAVGSRGTLDEGWLPESRETGLSGLRLAPDLCMTFGVSGANFHTIGIYRSAYIIAVNTDPKARIFRLADYCVFADADTVLEDLLKNLPEKPPVSAEEIKDYVLSRVRNYPHKINAVRIND